MKSLTSKWGSLSQLKDYLEKNHPEEPITSFDGITLITNKNQYQLAFGKVTVKKHGK